MNRDELLAQRLAAETERRCGEAAAMGEGYRLFRSDPRFENDATGYRMIVDFQILEPGQGAPGTGMVFGPWPAASLRALAAQGEGKDG